MIVVVEGVDCTGKSTVCQLLAAALGALLYATPSGPYASQKDEINRHATDEEHYLFFLEAVRFASDELRLLQARGRSVVVDRYWLTTAVYHRAMGLAVDLSDFAGFLVPDLTVYLTVTDEVQEHRMKERGQTAGDLRMASRGQQLRDEYERLLLFAGKLVRVPTESLRPEEVVASICRQIRPDGE